MRTINDNWGKWEDPVSSLPGTQMTEGSYGKMCDYLSKVIPTIFGLFQWFGADADDERICTLQYLGYKLYRALDMVKDVYDTRGQVIRDEQCDVFRRFLNTNNNRVKNIEKFIKAADELLKCAFEENSILLDFGKKRLITRFRLLMEWLDEVRKDSRLKKLAMEKCEEWELNHHISIYDDVPGDFRRQAYALLDSMILLSIPSHATASFNDFGRLYQNTLNAFCHTEKWQANRDYLEAQILDDYKEKELTTNRQKESLLKEKYNKLRNTKEEFLKKFGIKPISINTDWGKAHLGQELYERLNNIHLSSDGDGELARMTDAELGSYLTIEAQIQYVADEIGKIKKKKERQSPIFLGVVDEEKLSDCFYEVHQQFFGKDAKLKLTGKFQDEAALLAFLFMALEKDRLINSKSYESGKKPFFDFFTIESEIPVRCTERTFYNRLTKDFGAFREKMLKGKMTVSDLKSSIHSDFQTILKTFHGSKKYAEVKRWKGE
ncbi:MAG: hypothetical protein J6W52_04465 [Bacteroidaceae bacterium]|nr:hypothetical protein [Bacteroidaceae bacterium]